MFFSYGFTTLEGFFFIDLLQNGESFFFSNSLSYSLNYRDNS